MPSLLLQVDGTLPLSQFQYYVQQDSLYLAAYAKVRGAKAAQRRARHGIARHSPQSSRATGNGEHGLCSTPPICTKFSAQRSAAQRHAPKSTARHSPLLGFRGLGMQRSAAQRRPTEEHGIARLLADGADERPLAGGADQRDEMQGRQDRGCTISSVVPATKEMRCKVDKTWLHHLGAARHQRDEMQGRQDRGCTISSVVPATKEMRCKVPCTSYCKTLGS